MTDEDRASLAVAWTSTGGRVLRDMLVEQAMEPQSELYEIMARRPDTLTGKTALKYAIRSKALSDFIELVDDEVKILAQKVAA